MNARFQHLVKSTAAALVVAGGLFATAAPSRADWPIVPDFRANLKLRSSLSEPVVHSATRQTVRVLEFWIENDGFVAAPASTTSVTIEAGDPFSPISTAIEIKNYATPALAAGARSWTYVKVIPDTVYIKVDIRADATDVVNERTNHDNHRVHSVGYVP